MKKIGWPILYVFLLKPFKAWIFEKIQIAFWAMVFQKKTIVFQRKQFDFKFPLFFCFASFDNLKAVTDCLENLKF